MSAKRASRPRPASAPARPVTIASHFPRLRLDRRALTRAIHALDAEFSKSKPGAVSKSKIENRRPKTLSCPPGELSLVFLSDPALAQLHATFLADSSMTDVITFEGDPALGVAGEICVSVDTAAAYAKRHRRDFATELLLYVVHGWLHLAGYDDLQPAKKRFMRRAEARALRLLGPLQLFRLRPR
ncbi:MAG: rRNA maturation RNase YbeY [Undibacterium sp.]|nr:rRNA maturation RNase YbeY [Opitutaceae bacterium]